jgi:hypothetical protein
MTMAENQPERPLSPSELSDRLHEIAQLLRGTHHLGPEAQQALAHLADQLGNLWDPETTAPAEAAPLLESTSQVVESLRHENDSGPLAAARERLEETVAALEARAPRAADFARRLLETLSNLGI